MTVDSDTRPAAKDCWDKVEIAGKITGAVLIPILVGGIAFLWNHDSSQRQVAAQMAAIAVGVLQAETKPDSSSNALRAWAVEVLRHPANPPSLSDEAADFLRIKRLPISYSAFSAFQELGADSAHTLKTLNALLEAASEREKILDR